MTGGKRFTGSVNWFTGSVNNKPGSGQLIKINETNYLQISTKPFLSVYMIFYFGKGP